MTKPKLLTRDEILAVSDRATEVVDVPEWGGAVTVRALSGAERDHYEASMMKYRALPNGQVQVEAVDTDNIRARLASLTIVDDEGQRMFKESDLLALGDKSAAALNRVFSAAQRLSRLSNQDIEALKTGLKAVPNESSGSDSPAISAGQ
jgi:hypothetical protein